MSNGRPEVTPANAAPLDAMSQVVGSTVLTFTNISSDTVAELTLALDDQGFISVSSVGPSTTASATFSLTLERIDIPQTLADHALDIATPQTGQVPLSFQPSVSFSIEPGASMQLRDGGDAVVRAAAPPATGSAVAVVSATEVFSVTNNSQADVTMEISGLPDNALSLSLAGVDATSTGLVFASLAPFARQTLETNGTLTIPTTFSPQTMSLGPNQTITSGGRLVAVAVIG
ncbi:MAG TPA: hypothetical protein VLR47_11735 [Rhodospirillales bacterium]|nr:hypothetical protein [Rhodospirillales bacterium]